MKLTRLAFGTAALRPKSAQPNYCLLTSITVAGGLIHPKSATSNNNTTIKTASFNRQPEGRLETAALRAPGLAAAICLALFVSAAAVQAQAWATVDDIDAASAGSRKVVTDSAGNIFVAGSMKDETGRNHAVITKSSDGGASWVTAADYPALNDPSAPNGALAGFTALASVRLANGEDHLIAAGSIHRDYHYEPLFSTQWLVVRSRDAGATWETIDLYTHPAYPQPQTGVIYGQVTLPSGIAWDSSGNIYISGWATERILVRNSPATNKHWLIRKGVETPGGIQWSNAGDFSYREATANWEFVTSVDSPVLACAGLDVFVAGDAGGPWHVRKSSDGGATWPVVDNFRFSSSDISRAFGIAADSAGDVYVAGFGSQVVKKTPRPQWIVRKGTAGGTVWSTVDQFQLPNGGAEAFGVTVDGSDNVHVTGIAWASGASPLYHWITRQRSAATGAWSTTDDFWLSTSKTAGGRAIAADPAGNLFTTGWAYDDASAYHGWIVRRRPAP